MHFLIKKENFKQKNLDVCHLVPADLGKRLIVKYSWSSDDDIIFYNFELS